MNLPLKGMSKRDLDRSILDLQHFKDLGSLFPPRSIYKQDPQLKYLSQGSLLLTISFISASVYSWSVQWRPVSRVQCTVYIVQSTLYNVDQSRVYSVHFTVYTLHWTL